MTTITATGRIYQTAGMPTDEEILSQAQAISRLGALRPRRSIVHKRPQTMMLATPNNRDHSKA